jgi:hypothetical protein
MGHVCSTKDGERWLRRKLSVESVRVHDWNYDGDDFTLLQTAYFPLSSRTRHVDSLHQESV